MSDNTLYEYLAIIPPDDQVSSDVLTMKKSCQAKYGWHAEAATRPHLTLFFYLASVRYERQVLESAAKIITPKTPFEISLFSFGHFAGPGYTIYVQVKNDRAIASVIKQLQDAVKEIILASHPHVLQFCNKPHLTIAKGISALDFSKAWPEWKNKPYESAFMADRVLLLRRKPGSAYGRFETVAELFLEGRKIQETQTRLF